MTAAIELSRHFTHLRFDSLPGGQVGQMKRLISDYLGVALAGARTDSGRIAGDFVVEVGGTPHATVLGRRERVPAMHAAFANAVSEHSIELDDVDEKALFHYGPPVVSAALAVGQWRRASGTQLLTATLAGCEMLARLSRATNPALRDRGFHTTPTCGVFGAAVAASHLLGLTTEQMTCALGLAGAQSSGLMEMYGPSMQKRVNPGPAARDGVTAAMLASMGYTGADTIFEGERGFGAAFSGQLDLDELVGELGSRTPVIVEHKAYSAARPIHNAIDCALELRGRLPGPLAEIRSIVVSRHPDWADYHLNDRPSTYHEAQVSLPYSVAAALTFGAALPAQYADEHLRDRDLQALTRRVTVQKDDRLPRGVSCRTMITLADGTTLESQVDDPKGSVGNPLTEDELADKFRMLTQPLLSTQRADAVLGAVADLESLPEVNDLINLVDPDQT